MAYKDYLNIDSLSDIWPSRINTFQWTDGRVYKEKEYAKMIYKITCKSNGKAYVGRSGTPNWRIASHLESLHHNRHRVEDFQEDFNKYGEESLVYEVLGFEFRGDKLEKEMQRKFKTNIREYGYNYKDQYWKSKHL